MKVLIIGATGETGKHLVIQALERGHQVTALVRNPEKIQLTHAQLSVVKGDVLDYDSVLAAVAGQEAVLSALGHKKFVIPTSILSRGTKNLIGAMEQQRVRRLICITSLGIGDSRFRLGLYYTLFVIPFITFFYFRDKAKQERIIRASATDWTIVRPGQLYNGKKRGTCQSGPTVGSYILTRFISRADVAHYMLDQLTDASQIKKTVGITN